MNAHTFTLTDRELDILKRKATGLSSIEIGEVLFIDCKTVEHHWNKVLQKLDCRGRSIGAIYKAYQLGLIAPPTPTGEQLAAAIKRMRTMCDELDTTVKILEGNNERAPQPAAHLSTAR
jgi:DNA-binding CsgD family transcriptional regulator